MKNCKKTINKILSLALSILMICSVISAAIVVSAETSVWDGTVADDFESGTGTKSDPYIIANAAQLAYLQSQSETTNCPHYYKLTSDIYLNDLSNYENWATQAPANNWKPIGSAIGNDWQNWKVFYGSFDGDGHTIYGLYVSTTTQFTGFFGALWSGNSYVKNLHFKNAYVTSTEGRVGGIVGKADETLLIENCSYEGTVKGKAYLGGLVGLYQGKVKDGNVLKLTIKNSYSAGMVAGGSWGVGGLVGGIGNKSAAIDVINSYSVADISATGGCEAGIIGRADGFGSGIEDVRINIVRSFYAGQFGSKSIFKETLVGSSEATGVTTTYSDAYYNSEKVNGFNWESKYKGVGKTTAQFADGTVTNLLNAASLATEEAEIWSQGTNYPVFKSATAFLENLELDVCDINFAAAKFNYSASVNNSVEYVKITPTGKETIQSITVNGEPVDSESKINVSLNVGNNTITVVTTDINGNNETYTVIIERREKGNAWDGTAAESLSGKGTELSPYLIGTAKEFKFFANQIESGKSSPNQYFKLTSDIYLNDITDYEDWDNSKVRKTLNTWTPAGYFTSWNNCALFRGVFDGNGYTIYGLYTNEDTEDLGTGLFGAIGYGADDVAVVKNLNISSAYIIGKKGVGGLAGIAAGKVDIINTHFNGIITTADDNRNKDNAFLNSAKYIGGLIGKIDYKNAVVNIENCSTVGENRSQYIAGGIVGGTTEQVGMALNIRNSYSAMDIGYGDWKSVRLGGFVGYISSNTTVVNIVKSHFSGSSTYNEFNPIVGYIVAGADVRAADVYYTALASNPTVPAGATGLAATAFTDGTVVNLLNGSEQTDYKTDLFNWQQGEAYPTPVKILYGDCNGDGKVDILDLVKIKKYSVYSNVSIVKLNADLKANNVINADDIARLRQKLLGDNVVYSVANSDIVSNYMAAAESKKTEIFASETTDNVTGNKYYVSASGDDNNNGLTPATAWKTVAKVDSVSLNSGDGVFFNRGDVFRITEPLTVKDGVTYSAYGTGSKPEIIASVDASNPEYWETTSYPNIYHCTLKFPTDCNVGTIVFNGGEAWGIQVQKKPVPDKNGVYWRLENGTVFNGLETFTDSKVEFTGENVLSNNLEFYNVYDETDDVGDLYLYSKDGNPGNVFESIEIADKGHVLTGTARNVTVDNLSIFGTGSHAICFDAAVNTTVQYCTFSWIGGSIQSLDTRWRMKGIRYGNAVEAWACNNFTIHDCYATQVYDSCWSVQSQGGDIIGFEGYNNIADLSACGYEVWNSGGTIKNMNLHDSYTRFSGYGWSHQRNAEDGTFFHGSNNTDNEYENNNICNNINLFASNYSHNVAATAPSQYNFHNNVYVMENGKLLGGILENPGEGIIGTKLNLVVTKYDEASIAKAYETGFERGSKFYYTEFSPYANMYNIFNFNNAQ